MESLKISRESRLFKR